MRQHTQIVSMQPEYWPRVLEIYAQGLETGNATFETQLPSWEKWDQAHHRIARLVFIEESEVTGWAALSPVSSRDVYRGVAEVSVYVDGRFRQKGYGKELLEALISAAESEGVWTLQASIFPENVGSRRLHLGCGFREVGRRERIAQLNGEWRDTILYERRSKVIA